MKNKGFVLLVLLLLVGAVFVSCDNAKKTTDGGKTSASAGPTDAEYTVSIVNYKGTAPDTDILVEFHDGESTIMKKADKDGKAVFKMEKGEYTFSLKAAKGDIYYNPDDCVFTAEKTAATVAIYNLASEKREIYVSFGKENQAPEPYQAAVVKEGATYVEIDRTDRAYYIFEPERGGFYRFSCISDEGIDIGYYGNPHAVMNHKAEDVTDGKFEIEVKNFDADMQGGGNVLVLGISSETVKSAVWVIERFADPTKEVAWTYVDAKTLPKEFPRTDDKQDRLVNVSLTDASVKLIYNEQDGFYHYGSADGALVYVYISEPSRYIAAFSEICETAMLGKITYENGVIVKKECYNNLLNSYKEVADANGLCPLTEELKTAVKNIGEQMKWWDFSASGNEILSKDVNDKDTGIKAENIITENAWMFACCYLKEN